MKNKNCPNCAAPYDPNLIKCPYCGTIYFDFPALDADNHTPVWLRFKHDNKLILYKARLSCVNCVAPSVDTDLCVDYRGYSRAEPEVTTTLEFIGDGNTIVIDKENVDGDSY